MKTKPSLKRQHSLTALVLMWMLGFSVCVQAQSTDWKWQNPLPTGNTMYDAHFSNAEIGWAVGAFGTIIKTTNGGSNWSVQKSDVVNDLRSIHFVNIQTGWAVGDSGIILKTTNGGNSWFAQTSGTLNKLMSVYFVDTQIGSASGERGTILRTTNGGYSWQNQSIPSLNINDLPEIYFFDALNGWFVGKAAGSNTLFKTTNGGNTWIGQETEPDAALHSIHFINTQVGWVVGYAGLIQKTTNGGDTWVTQLSGTDRWLLSVHFIDDQNGYVVGGDDNSSVMNTNILLVTTNGGENWISRNSGTPHRYWNVSFSDSQTGWIFGEYGTILKTTNGGNDWVKQVNGTNELLRCIKFTDALNGIVVGYGGTILKTNNGGRNWVSQNSGTTRALNGLYVHDNQQAWAVGSSGTILHTTNGGTDWNPQISGTTKELKDVFFIDAQNGWAVGDDATIRRTTNGGRNWQAQNGGALWQTLLSVFFIDSQNGWVVGGSGGLARTTNGGNIWVVQNSGIAQSLTKVFFTDSRNGWIVAVPGIIKKTTNGGNNWLDQISGTSQSLISVHFIDSLQGFAVGAEGVILKTSNGGNIWETQMSKTNIQLNDVFFSDANHGWAIGWGGTILTTTTNNPINPETLTSMLSGSLFEKSGSNCDPSNMPVSGKLVRAMPGSYYGISNQNGNYELRVPLPDSVVNFALQPVIPANTPTRIETVCPPSGQIDVQVNTTPDTLAGNNFGFEITQCHHLDVQMSSNRRRRCFTNNTDISYFNEGALPAANSYLLVEFPRWVRPLSASRSHIALSDSVWRFDLGNVAPRSGGQISITDSVLCGNEGILGLAQCTKATIFPAPDCPSPAWSGAEISLSGQCTGNGFAELGIYNRTAVAMTEPKTYQIYLDSILVMEGQVQLTAGDSLKFQVETEGMTVHMHVAQVSNHPSSPFSSVTVGNCATTNPGPIVSAMNFPLEQQPNSKTQCLPIIGAYDPNDKQVFPLGFTANRIVPPNTKLEYLVRFQNTGNDTAFTVYIIDTLHTNLNVESFEMGAASHPYQLSMQTTKSGKTWLRWQFNNILLPDSGTNQLASNGFVQFRISPKPNLPLGTQVYNEADIYFDFNPPILTNQTLTTFDIIRYTDTTLNRNVRVILPTGIPSALRNAMKLYPNPVTNNQLNINFAEAGSLTLYDARGLTVYSKTNLIGEHTLPVSLKRGMYVARIQSAGGSWSEKVVVE